MTRPPGRAIAGFEFGRLQTLHVHADDVPYVQLDATVAMRTRVLHARPDEGFIVSQLQAGPRVVSALHVHNGPAFGWTNSGAWGHDEQFTYHTGTYVFETPGVRHRFMSGPDEVNAVYVVHGTVDFIDDDTGDIVSSRGAKEILGRYLAACEEAALPRPNVLG